MANEVHLKILSQGVGVWNRWRSEYREVRPNLIGADLRNANLAGCNFSDANLGNADLRSSKLTASDLSNANLYYAYVAGSDLSGSAIIETSLLKSDFTNANLTRAVIKESNLAGAVFQGADFTGARLTSANLTGASLYRARLTGTSLYGANLTGASLREADVSDAHTGRTIFDDINLREVKGLESINHVEPSEISISTIYRSEGKIPEVFLRGCGVPESFIVQIPALVAAMQPIQFYSCFISYSGKDKKFAERLHADLQNKGVRCWYAPHDLKVGEKIRVGIDESIRVHEKLLLILSKNSIESEWVEKEVETAMERERQQKRAILFPIRLDDAVLSVESGWAADVRRSRNIGDFRRWKSHDAYSKAFEKLLRDLKASVLRNSSADER